MGTLGWNRGGQGGPACLFRRAGGGEPGGTLSASMRQERSLGRARNTDSRGRRRRLPSGGVHPLSFGRGRQRAVSPPSRMYPSLTGGRPAPQGEPSNQSGEITLKNDLTALTPYIEVFDMVASVVFYRDLLGFEVVFASPEVETKEGRFSHHVRLRRAEAEIMLNTAYDSDERPPERSEPRWSGCRHVRFYIDCDDVVAVHIEMVGRGLNAAPPAQTAYGYLGFSTSDPDGYGLTFHQAPS